MWLLLLSLAWGAEPVEVRRGVAEVVAGTLLVSLSPSLVRGSCVGCRPDARAVLAPMALTTGIVLTFRGGRRLSSWTNEQSIPHPPTS